MLLSIGMIVKNEENNLRACLNGIKPILEQVDGELIIADTGSSDGTAEIARSFTENVYQIEWRGDFGWARNTTLERAAGKWFMFLDADEFFQDVSEIIWFFNSGEYKKYACASHLRYETGAKSCTEVMRLYRKDRDTAFIGRIHEYIPIKNPVKRLGSVSAHTGYAFGGEGGRAKKEAKKKRNLEPLLEAHKEDPENLRIINQIVGVALGDREKDMADKFLAIGLALREKDTDDIFYHALRRNKILRLMNAGKTREAIDETEDYFKTSKKLYSSSIMIRILEAMLFDKEGMRRESLETFKRASELYEDYLDGRLDNKDEVLTITEKVLENSGVLAAKGVVMQCAWLGDFNAAFEWIKKGGLNVSELLAPLRPDAMGGPGGSAPFWDYIKAAYGFLPALYGAEALEGAEAGALPERDKFVYYAGKALEAKERGDAAACASLLKDALRFDMSLKGAVTAALEGLANSAGQGAEAINRESAALKQAIYGLISWGEIMEAARILEQYAMLNPSDPEIAVILDKLQSRCGGAEPPSKSRDETEIIFIMNNISYTRNGIMNSVLQKARLMEERLGRRPRILIHGYNLELPLINLTLQNEKGERRARLVNGASVESVYDYFQQTPYGGFEYAVIHEKDKDARYVETEKNVYDVYRGEELARKEYYLAIAGRLRLVEYFKDGKRERGVYYDDWGNVSKIRFYDASGPDGGRFLSEEFYDTGGRLRIRNAYGYKTGGIKQESVTVYDENGGVKKECGDDIGLLALYLELTMEDGKAYMLVAEDGLSARAVAAVRKDNVIKAATVHSSFLEDAYDLGSAPQPYYKDLCENREKFGAIVFLTEAERADFYGKYGGGSAGLRVITHPYPYPVIKTDFEKRNHMKAVIVTRLEKIKLTGAAIEIFAMAAAKLPGITLDIYGAGPEEDNCKELIKRLGLEGRAVIKGFTDDPAAVFSGAAVSLMTSYAEGFSLSMVESVCNGCPAFAFDVKYGPSDIIRDGETGFLIPRFDKRAYALKLIEYFKNIELQRTMSENCYAAAARFGADESAAAWAGLADNIQHMI